MNLLTRFIPAGAGNTRRMIDEVKIQAVYPRWRGEHRERLRSQCVLYGLSPLARGTPRTASQPVRPVRFIPAGAGNTARWLPTTGQPSVYPRWRGEHVLIAVVTVGICGLSPLARGTPHQNPPENAHPRFIPAGAGNTDFDVEKIRTSAVYPRWRGEHITRITRGFRTCGLSPLARGTRASGIPA